MKKFIKELKDKVLGGYEVTREDIDRLLEISVENKEDFETLLKSANEIREKFCGNYFNLCTILNAKSGHCSENCKY